MDKLLAVVGLIAVLVLVGRGTSARAWPVVIAATLAVVVVIVALERAGYWPREWTTR